MTIRNKSVIITGATAGIGRAAALQLAALGADVVTGPDPERGSATEEALRAAGSPRARFVRADHSTLEGNLALAAEIEELVDRVDVLVNNKGGLIPRRESNRPTHILTAFGWFGIAIAVAFCAIASAVTNDEALSRALYPDSGDASVVVDPDRHHRGRHGGSARARHRVWLGPLLVGGDEDRHRDRRHSDRRTHRGCRGSRCRGYRPGSAAAIRRHDRARCRASGGDGPVGVQALGSHAAGIARRTR